MASFFVSSTRSVRFFVQHHQLELRTSKKYSKRQKLVHNKTIDVQNLENIGSPHWCFSHEFFRYYATFLEVFWIPPKDIPFVCFDFLQNSGCQKIPKDPPFTFFGTMTLFKNLILIFFRKFFKISQGSPFNFFHILQLTGVSQSPKDPPFYNFEP